MTVYYAAGVDVRGASPSPNPDAWEAGDWTDAPTFPEARALLALGIRTDAAAATAADDLRQASTLLTAAAMVETWTAPADLTVPDLGLRYYLTEVTP